MMVVRGIPMVVPGVPPVSVAAVVAPVELVAKPRRRWRVTVVLDWFQRSLVLLLPMVVVVAVVSTATQEPERQVREGQAEAVPAARLLPLGPDDPQPMVSVVVAAADQIPTMAQTLFWVEMVATALSLSVTRTIREHRLR